MLPAAGATCAVIKLFYNYAVELKNKRQRGSVETNDYLKLFSMMLVSIWGIAILSFMVMWFWFPTIEMPQSIRIVGFIVIVPYLIVVGALHGLSRVVAGGAGSATGVINSLLGRPVKTFRKKNKSPGKWIRRPEGEIIATKKILRKSSFSPTMPIGVFFLSFIFVMAITGDSLIDIALFCSLLASGLTYIVQISRGRSLAKSPVIKICSDCQKESYLGLKKCSCGGTYEPPEYFTYVELID